MHKPVSFLTQFIMSAYSKMIFCDVPKLRLIKVKNAGKARSAIQVMYFLPIKHKIILHCWSRPTQRPLLTTKHGKVSVDQHQFMFIFCRVVCITKHSNANYI